MQPVRLAPKFKMWLVFGTTAGLIVLALLMLFFVWRSAPIPKSELAAMPQAQRSAIEIYPGQTSRLLSATIRSPDILKQGPGLGPNNNLPALALGSGVALGLASATLRLARRRRFMNVRATSEPGHNLRQFISPSPSL
jgi:hypothetical protein